MSRRRKERRAEKARRHAQPSWPAEKPTLASAARVVVRETSQVERLAYTRSQAAQALGISRSTLRRLLPYVETIEMPWGTKLIPVDELERLAAERRRPARACPRAAAPGRPAALAEDVVERIRTERDAGKSYGAIASALNDERIPTAHGGAHWWPSTVRAILSRGQARSSASGGRERS